MVGTWSKRRPCSQSLNPAGGLGALGTCLQTFRCISINYHKPGYVGLWARSDWGTGWLAQTEARNFCKRGISWPFQGRAVLAGFGVCCRLGDLGMGLLAAATGVHRVNVSPRNHAGGEEQSLPPAAAASRWRLSFGSPFTAREITPFGSFPYAGFMTHASVLEDKKGSSC